MTAIMSWAQAGSIQMWGSYSVSWSWPSWPMAGSSSSPAEQSITAPSEAAKASSIKSSSPAPFMTITSAPSMAFMSVTVRV